MVHARWVALDLRRTNQDWKEAMAVAKVLITGTSKGIGYDTTLLLARAGHEVVATMRNPGACDLEKVAAEAKLPVTVLPLDVDDDASVAGVFGKVGDSIDVLVNNAGIYSINAVEDESLEQFRRVMETNYFGAVRCVKASAPGDAKAGLGLHHQRDVDRRADRLLRRAAPTRHRSSPWRRSPSPWPRR